MLAAEIVMVTDDATDIFRGGGEMGARMRELDWSATPMGCVATWSQSLKSVLGICLGSRFPIAVYWGARLSLLYNDAWSPILGSKHPWALGRDAREVWPEIWDQVGPLFEHVMTTGESTYSEDALLPMRRHGYTEECYFNFTFTPVRGSGGQVEGVFNAVVETTYRVVSERRNHVLRELGERLARSRSPDEACEAVGAVLGDAPHDVPFSALYVVDAERRAVRCVCSGLEPDGPLAPPTLVVAPGAVWPLSEAESSGEIIVVERLAERFGASLPGGAWPEPADTAFVAPLCAAGKVLGFLILGKNPRRAFDADYRQFVDRAASLIAAALANVRAYEEERRRAEALAELDRAKTTFFANVSHEFRTPLTLMIGPTEDALNSPEGVLAGEDLRTVYRNELRLMRLVDTLLEFTRIEAGRMQATFEPVDLAAFTRELAGLFRSTVERAGLRYVVDCAPLGEPAYVDPEMWETIILNLLSNAFKFTFTGEIRVALRRTERGAELSVKGTGIGVDDKEISRIFERFHRVEGARGRSDEGSGIGLALVRDLVRLHGGEISATSRPGEGTTFTLVLPLGRAHLPAERIGTAGGHERKRAAAEAYVAEARRWIRDETSLATRGPLAPEGDRASTILVVDDNADMRDYLTRVLSARYSVRAVANGEEALAAVRAERPDLIVTDVMMPGLDGFGLLAALRSETRTAAIPVIMLSARAGEEARVEGLEAGADDYLVKPFSARELVARVATHLHLARLRAAAESERRRMYELFEQVPVAIVVYEGPNFRIAFQNKVARDLSQSRWIGRTFADVVYDAPNSPAMASLQRVFATGRAESNVEMPLTVVNDRGEPVQHYITTYRQALRDDSGAIVGVVGVGYDVTQEVVLRRAAQQASRAKDEFLAMLGHELRNPLSPILTALQLLRMRGGTTRELAIIERQVGHLIRLVDDLLDISRITRGKVELRRERLELAEVVVRGLETAGPLLEQRRQRVEFDVAPEGLPIDGDPDRLAQVVSNLLTNAAKYSEPGTVVRVVGERADDKVRLRVIDQGIGLAPELLGRVFELFVQQPQAPDRSKGGLGLGLAIVRSLVALHGGRVWAESEGPGKGSEFVVELPAAAPLESGPCLERDSRPRRQAPVASAQKNRILVVDDNVDAAESIAELLRDLGHETVVAHDGPSALEAARSLHPNFCLLDIGLPVMDGYELAQRLRASGDLPEGARIVALTGYGQDADRRRSAEAGFDTHLVKPISLDVLADVLVD